MGIQEKDEPIRQNLRAGPHGLGDPEDKSLRRLERDVIILNKVRAAAEKKCKDVLEIFMDCANKNGLLVTFKCRKENNEQIKCLEKWYYDENLRKEMTEEYLRERSEYRRTGIGKPVENLNRGRAVSH